MTRAVVLFVWHMKMIRSRRGGEDVEGGIGYRMTVVDGSR